MEKMTLETKKHTYAVEEAMNRLRVNIKFAGKDMKKILVVSTFPNEGKSSIAFNLWKMLAEAGHKSVLVDTDMRKTVLEERHNMKGVKKEKDIGCYLAGTAEYEDVVYETNIENAYCVPCVNIIESPALLLESDRLKELLEKLSEEHRYVIVDTPPLDSVSDGSLVASHCDGAILVVESGQTSRKFIAESLKQLDATGCKVIGMVLNKSKVKNTAYKKYKKYGYSYADDGKK